MNDMFGGIPPWSCTTQFSNLNAKNKTTQVGQNDFKNFLGTEKVKLSKEAKMFKEALALIKEVGLVEFTRIARTVDQIQRALTKAMQDFSVYKEEIEGMIDFYHNQMPRSVSDAFSRLHSKLNDSKLPQEVIDTIIRYVKEEMKQSLDSKVYDNKMNLIDMKS